MIAVRSEMASRSSQIQHCHRAISNIFHLPFTWTQLPQCSPHSTLSWPLSWFEAPGGFMLCLSHLWSHLRDWDELNSSELHRLHSLPKGPRQTPMGGRKWTEGWILSCWCENEDCSEGRRMHNGNIESKCRRKEVERKEGEEKRPVSKTRHR